MDVFRDQLVEQKAKEEEFRRAEGQCQLHFEGLAKYLDQNKHELREKGISFRIVPHPNRPPFGMYESGGKIVYVMYPQSEFVAVITLPTGHAFAVVSSWSHGDCRYTTPWSISETRSGFELDGERHQGVSLPNEAKAPEDVMKAIVAKYVVQTKIAEEQARIAATKALEEEQERQKEYLTGLRVERDALRRSVAVATKTLAAFVTLLLLFAVLPESELGGFWRFIRALVIGLGTPVGLFLVPGMSVTIIVDLFKIGRLNAKESGFRNSR